MLLLQRRIVEEIVMRFEVGLNELGGGGGCGGGNRGREAAIQRG